MHVILDTFIDLKFNILIFKVKKSWKIKLHNQIDKIRKWIFAKKNYNENKKINFNPLSSFFNI